MPDPRLATLLPRDYGRIYTHPVTREEHVSTTTVLKLWPKKLDRWAAGEAAGEAWDQRQWLLNVTREQAVDALQGAPERSRNKAGTHGSLVHDGCHMLAMRKAGWELTAEQNQKLTAMLLGRQGESVKQALFRFSEFLEKYVKRVLYLEQTVWGNGWAGTFDAIFELHDGRIVLVDYKTGKGIFTEIRLQFSSYFYAPIMLNAEGVETPMPPLDLCAYLHLPQVGGYSFKDVQITEADLATFERLLLNWYWNESVPRNFGVAIPIAAAPRVPGVHDCGVHKPTARGNPGTIACIRPEGHDGDHHGKDAKTGSRNYHWSDNPNQPVLKHEYQPNDVPGADVLANAEAEGAPHASAQRPVLNVLEGGATDSATGAAPLQGSIGASEDPEFYGATPVDSLISAIAHPDVPGASTGPETTDTSSPSGSDPISLPVPDVPGPEQAQPAPDSGGFPVPAPLPDGVGEHIPCPGAPDCVENYGHHHWVDPSGVHWVLPGPGPAPTSDGTPELDEAQSYSSKIAERFTRTEGA